MREAVQQLLRAGRAVELFRLTLVVPAAGLMVYECRVQGLQAFQLQSLGSALGPLEFNLSVDDWVAVQELNLNYHKLP